MKKRLQTNPLTHLLEKAPGSLFTNLFWKEISIKWKQFCAYSDSWGWWGSAGWSLSKQNNHSMIWGLRGFWVMWSLERGVAVVQEAFREKLIRPWIGTLGEHGEKGRGTKARAKAWVWLEKASCDMGSTTWSGLLEKVEQGPWSWMKDMISFTNQEEELGKILARLSEECVWENQSGWIWGAEICLSYAIVVIKV